MTTWSWPRAWALACTWVRLMFAGHCPRRLGADAVIGGTCHAQLELAERAANEGASYIAFGRFFNSNTKPGAPAATVELLDEARARFAQPIVAIGGVTLGTAPNLIARAPA